MATEAQRAPDVARQRTITPPRVQPGRGSLAKAAERSIFEHQTAGVTPFSDHNGTEAAEEARNILAEASCLANVLSTAYADAQSVHDAGNGAGELQLMMPRIHEHALAGLNRLIQLADFYVERSMAMRA